MSDEYAPAKTSGSEVEQRVILGAVPRLLKLGRCVASSAPRAMVKDLAQHEGLHPRLSDCFSWTWDARASGDAYQCELEARIRHQLETERPTILEGPATFARCTYPNGPCICTGVHDAVLEVEAWEEDDDHA